MQRVNGFVSRPGGSGGTAGFFSPSRLPLRRVQYGGGIIILYTDCIVVQRGPELYSTSFMLKKMGKSNAKRLFSCIARNQIARFYRCLVKGCVFRTREPAILASHEDEVRPPTTATRRLRPAPFTADGQSSTVFSRQAVPPNSGLKMSGRWGGAPCCLPASIDSAAERDFSFVLID